jgi:hypothetical protein
MKNFFSESFLHDRYSSFFIILFFALAGFVAGFFSPLRFAIPLRYDFLLPFVFVFIVLWSAWLLPHPWDKLISVAITTSLFSASLVALWRTGFHEVYEVFGLIPWFDSQGYYSEALRLLNGGIFSEISARRPIFPGFFAFILMLTNNNLRVSIALLSFFAGISTWIISRELKLSEGKAIIPAGISVLSFFFYRKFNGAVLTETLGFSLGFLGLVLLWNAATNRKLFPAYAGLFCVTLAMSTRPGAVFSLPLIILWIVFCLKTESGKLPKLFVASAVFIGSLSINIILTAILAPGISSSYSNFANLIYGLVNGGIGWHAVYVDHPEFFATGNEGFAAQQIYRASWEIFISHPERAISGAIRSVSAFFSTANYSAFNFIGGDDIPSNLSLQNAPVAFIGRWSANILLILLLPVAIIARKNPKYTLLLAINLGIIFSLPFAAPWDVENMRAYTATIGGMISAVILVILFIIQKGKQNPPVFTGKPAFAYGLTTFLIFSLISGPILIRLTAKIPILPIGQCLIGESPLITQISSGSIISIGINPEDPFSIPYSRFQVNLNQFPDAKIGERLRYIPENSYISQQNDLLRNGKAVWLIAPFNIIPKSDIATIFCGNWGSEPETDYIFYARHTLP